MPGILFTTLLAQTGAAPDELYDIVVLAPKEPVWPLILYLALALLLVAGLAVLIWYLLRSRTTASAGKSALARARDRIRELERRHRELDPNPFSLALSDTLKDFLSESFADPVRFETAQEFLNRISREETRLPPSAQQELREFLSAAEEVKFGNAPDAADRTLPLLHKASSLLALCETINSQNTAPKPCRRRA